MRLFFFRLSIFIFLGLFSTSIYANEFGASVKIGTLGFGADLTMSFAPNINGRLGFNTFSYTYDGKESDVEYDIDFENQVIRWKP